MERFISRALRALPFVTTIAACASAPESQDGARASAESPLIGGEPAGDDLDAVGAIVAFMSNGSVAPFCTGTLVDPDTVLTAKHCLVSAPSNLKIGFALGADAFHPHTLVPEAEEHARDWENTVADPGAMGLGSDVAVLHLARRVSFVRPAKLGALAPSDVGKRFESAGFGRETDRTAPDTTLGRRRVGSFTLRSLDGKVMELTYGSFAAFDQVARAVLPPEVVADPTFSQQLQQLYDETKLSPGLEAYFGQEQGPDFVCNGDSGGPVFSRDRAGRITVYGVTSGGRALDPSCMHGSIWATFAPGSAAAAFLAQTRACRELANGGYCNREKVVSEAVTCDAGGGRPHARTVSCDLHHEACSDTPHGATCARKCTSDSECAALAPGGTCDVASGSCVYLRQCTAESTYFACTLCCGAVYPDPTVCAQGCAAPPGATPMRVAAMKLRPVWPPPAPR